MRRSLSACLVVVALSCATYSAAFLTAADPLGDGSGSAAPISTIPADAALGTALDSIVDAPEFKHSHWGLLVVEADGGRFLYERNADKLFAPASVTKLFSVAAALDELGADHRFETPVYARGDVDAEGLLTGDLVLVASGDLTMGGRAETDGKICFKNTDHTYAGFASKAELTEPDPLAGLDDLARQVRAAGIRHVQGEVLIDDRLFAQASSTGSGPTHLSPIVVNDNVLDFTFTPGEVGEPVTTDWRPRNCAYTIDAVVTTGAADSKPTISIDEPLRGTITVRGSIPAGRGPVVLVHEADDAASFARTLFIEALRRAEVQVDASPLSENAAASLPRRETYPMLKRVALLKSAPFSEEIKLILKVSHNLHASTLPLLLAAKHGRRTLAEGLQVEHDALARLGVGVESISFGGGAGGDRGDYVTPRAAVELLTAMSQRDDFAVYRDALPILGVDGTLADAAAADSPARGKVRAKTGTLLWSNTLNARPILQSKALAGYAETKSGRKIVFACFVNLVHLKEPGDRERIGRVLGTICEKLHESL